MAWVDDDLGARLAPDHEVAPVGAVHLGDLLVRLDLVVPQKLSRAQKEALEKFAALDGAHDLRSDLFAKA